MAARSADDARSIRSKISGVFLRKKQPTPKRRADDVPHDPPRQPIPRPRTSITSSGGHHYERPPIVPVEPILVYDRHGVPFQGTADPRTGEQIKFREPHTQVGFTGSQVMYEDRLLELAATLRSQRQEIEDLKQRQTEQHHDIESIRNASSESPGSSRHTPGHQSQGSPLQENPSSHYTPPIPGPLPPRADPPGYAGAPDVRHWLEGSEPPPQRVNYSAQPLVRLPATQGEFATKLKGAAGFFPRLNIDTPRSWQQSSGVCY